MAILNRMYSLPAAVNLCAVLATYVVCMGKVVADEVSDLSALGWEVGHFAACIVLLNMCIAASRYAIYIRNGWMGKRGRNGQRNVVVGYTVGCVTVVVIGTALAMFDTTQAVVFAAKLGVLANVIAAAAYLYCTRPSRRDMWITVSVLAIVSALSTVMFGALVGLRGLGFAVVLFCILSMLFYTLLKESFSFNLNYSYLRSRSRGEMW